MSAIIFLLFSSIWESIRSRAALQAEIFALRHQLLVMQRTARGRKLDLRWADRVLWIWLSQLWSDWRSALLILKPETVIAWHRRGFRLYWRWKSRHSQGRPCVPQEVIDLIRKMSLANPRWGWGTVETGIGTIRGHRRQVHGASSQTPSRPGEFHPEPLTDPDMSLSTHPARATQRRLPPSVKTRSSSGYPLTPS